MQIRLGIPTSFRRFSAVAKWELNAPLLVSANALRRDNGQFVQPRADLFAGADIALDSAGFVAMVRYGGFPWSLRDYVTLAASYPWAWWAAMDYCCEREIAADAAQVDERIRKTVLSLRDCNDEAERQGIARPLAVLQGWTPADYLRCYEWMLPQNLPDLIGIGSVCRRPLSGPDGLLNVIGYLDGQLPPRHRFHLFGVKGAAVASLAGHPRIASIDSMAWDAGCRRRHKGSRTIDVRADYMRAWYRANVDSQQRDQLNLGLA